MDREIDRCRRQGIEPPKPLSHPDDLFVDMRTSTIRFHGRMTPEEEAAWDDLRARKADIQHELAELRQTLIDDPEDPHRAIITDEIAHNEKMLAMIRKMIAD